MSNTELTQQQAEKRAIELMAEIRSSSQEAHEMHSLGGACDEQYARDIDRANEERNKELEQLAADYDLNLEELD